MMRGPRTALSRHSTRDRQRDDPRPTPTARVLIHREGGRTWELVGGGPGWSVELTAADGVTHQTLDAFEASEDGQRLANSLTVALARTPDHPTDG